MKKMKKLVGILLTLAMIVAMSVTAFAEETSSGYKIYTNSTGHTYEIYQIFTGDYADGVLSNVKWGTDGKRPEGVEVGGKVDSATLKALTDVNSMSDTGKLAVIKNYANLTTVYGKVTSDRALENVPVGYYLIKDEDESQKNENASYTLYIVNVVKENVEIKPKADVPTSEKKVKDVNDSGNTAHDNDWIDSADYDIGDKVPFQLKGIVASDYANYNVYKFVFHDKESAGLTFEASTVEVFVDGVKIENPTEGEPYYRVTTPDDGDTFDVTFADLKKITSTSVHAGSVITVEYKSILNENAVLGSAGNPNTMHLEYSNNPNDAQGGETGKTPDDTVIVFTYKLDVNKVDENKNPLSGAEFILEKKGFNNDGNETWTSIAVIKNEAGTTFTFKGLDDGVYKLSETKTPSRYNTIEPIIFTVSATHDILANNPKLTALTGEAENGVITLASTKKEGSNNDPAGELSTTVENKKGTTLPSTGGMGTTILYVIGAILVIGAGILLITKKRMNANK